MKLDRHSLFLLTALSLCCSLVMAHDGDHPHEHGNQDILTTREQSKTLPPAKADDVFHFVVYGDRTGGVPAGLKVLKQAVADTNLLDPDLVMTVGDLIQGYNETPQWMEQMKEYRQIMSELNMQWFPVAGNHDVYWRGQGPAPQGQHESNYEKHFGPLWYSFEHKNAGFIVLYSDEGDPKTNRKAFNDGKLQTMSDEQLAFLDKALESLSGAEHVFCFLHHPRWIGGGYSGGNWDVVHQKLVDAGNVTAVFAGHIHHMRYDGPKDGIEYYTLATTGGHLSAEIPDAGFLHHLNLVTVRESGIKVAALPIGSVIDPTKFTPEFLAEIEKARAIRPMLSSASEPLILKLDGSCAGSVVYEVQNTSSFAIDYSASFNAGQNDQWRSTLDHTHFVLEAGEKRSIEFEILRDAQAPPRNLPEFVVAAEVLADNSRIRLPAANLPLDVRPAVVPAGYFRNSPKKCLEINGPASAVRVDANQIEIPDGAMTLEAWVRPIETAGYNGIIAKTQSSEYALFSDEGVPQFDINLDGKYYTAAASDKLSTETWTHLAGVYDGANVRLFVNGKEVAKTPAKGRRKTNRLPLYIGADPDSASNPTRPFRGYIDEVRLSSTAVYSTDFKPRRTLLPTVDTALLLHLDRSFGPFVLDHSSNAAQATIGPATKIVDQPE